MHIYVTRQEITNFVIEHQNDTFFEPDSFNLECFVTSVQEGFTKPRCSHSQDYEGCYEDGGCPC
ncbi:MAG: hypothetical protein LBS98_01750, partial [Coriobacteriales bacterium]|nr:hypothetical protein [Coriobacteriales bacterium]